MAKKKVSKNDSGATVFAVAAVAAAAGAAFLFSDEGTKTRKKIKGWSLRAKGEILEKIEDAKEMSEDRFKKTVDTVLGKYTKVKKIENKEVQALMKEMTGHWKKIKKELAGATKDTKKAAKKTVRKTTAAVKGKKAPTKRKPVAKKVAKKTPTKKTPTKKTAKKTTKKK